MSSIRVARFDRIADFRSRAEPYLARDEALHNLMLGILSTLAAAPDAYSDQQPYLTLALHQEQVAGVCMMTPPYNVLLSKVADPEAIDGLISDVATTGIPVPGVTAAVPYAELFAGRWMKHTGRAMRRGLQQGIYRLHSVTPPKGARGIGRLATVHDRGLLLHLIEGFITEMSHGPGRENAAREVDRRLSHSNAGYYIWEVEDEPVSVAGFGGFTPSGARIGPVYTPIKLRGNGYASAVTALASQQLLDAGRTFCFLYTDLSNPTSNSIYRKIGYEMIGESEEWRIVDP